MSTPSRRRSFQLAVLGSVICIGAGAPIARASHPVSESDRAAIAEALDESVDCIEAHHSDKRPRWVEALNAVGSDADECPRYIDALLVRESTDTFRVVLLHPTDDACVDYGVPEDVGRELDFCNALSRRVYVWLFGFDRFFVRPKTIIQGAHGAYERLRWKHWGQRRATARGRFHYEDAYETIKAPVRVTLSARGRCGLRRAYRRIQITARRRSDRRRIRFATGHRRLRCGD